MNKEGKAVTTKNIMWSAKQLSTGKVFEITQEAKDAQESHPATRGKYHYSLLNSVTTKANKKPILTPTDIAGIKKTK